MLGNIDIVGDISLFRYRFCIFWFWYVICVDVGSLIGLFVFVLIFLGIFLDVFGVIFSGFFVM